MPSDRRTPAGTPRTYQSDDTEARIRSRLAQAHLKAGDAGAFDAAIATLVQVAVGKNEEGKPIKVRWRTRAGAAVALLREARAVAMRDPGAENPAGVLTSLADLVRSVAALPRGPAGLPDADADAQVTDGSRNGNA